MRHIISQLKFSKELNLILLSVFLLANAMGINFVTFPTILTQHGIGSLRIGIAATCEISAGILMSFFLSRLVAKIGLMKTLSTFSFIYAIATLLIFFYQSFYLWMGFSFIMGLSWFAYAITRQAWVNSMLTKSNRGVFLGFFNMTIAVGIGVGPLIVSFSGASTYLSFLISALLVIISFRCLSNITLNQNIHLESKRLPLIEFFKANPLCTLARFFAEFQTSFLIIFTVVFGNKIGFSPEKSGLLLSAFMASGFLDVSIGFFLKKHSPYKMINIGFLGCLICFIGINIFYENYILLLLIYFSSGIFVACIYVCALNIVNEDYPEKKLVAANSTFHIIGSIGSIIALVCGGYLISVFGPQGFTITIITSCLCYLTFLVFYKK